MARPASATRRSARAGHGSVHPALIGSAAAEPAAEARQEETQAGGQVSAERAAEPVAPLDGSVLRERAEPEAAVAAGRRAPAASVGLEAAGDSML